MVHSVHLTIYGRVQGVGFRLFVLKQAKKYAVNGWVKNVPDGSVEIRAEGELPALQKFKNACASGPLFARVRHIQEETAIRDSGQYTTFVVV